MKNQKLMTLLTIGLLSASLLTACGDAGYITASDLEGNEVSTQSVSTEADSGADTDNSQETSADVTVSTSTESVIADSESAAESSWLLDDTKDAPEVKGLTAIGKIKLDYATEFNVFYYADGYKVISVKEDRSFLVVSEGKEAPEDLPEGMAVIRQPLTNVYLAATSAASLLNAVDALDICTMTGTNEQGWSIDAPKEALASGKMKFAGRYSEPDYEMLVSENCDLAIESTMILHSPEVQEMIEDLGITVFMDRSSYEVQPLGRSEWIKLYAALVNKEDKAEAFFEKQEQVINDLAGFPNTGKTVAFFSVNTDGTVVVRRTKDYIPTMIEVAGGKYIFQDLENTANQSASVDLSIEEFYSKAVNADYLVYNATIEEALDGVDQLIEKNELFSEFKAVKEGHVYQVSKKMYQSTDNLGALITDFNLMVTEGDEGEMTFLSRVE